VNIVAEILAINVLYQIGAILTFYAKVRASIRYVQKELLTGIKKKTFYNETIFHFVSILQCLNSTTLQILYQSQIPHGIVSLPLC